MAGEDPEALPGQPAGCIERLVRVADAADPDPPLLLFRISSSGSVPALTLTSANSPHGSLCPVTRFMNRAQQHEQPCRQPVKGLMTQGEIFDAGRIDFA